MGLIYKICTEFYKNKNKKIEPKKIIINSVKSMRGDN